jgi:anti-sigma B factor antagonist
VSALLSVSEKVGSGAVTLYLEGELDLQDAEALQRRLDHLQQTYRGRLVIDLRGLDFLGSAGVAVLVRAESYARRDGWVLEIRQGGPQIRRVFEVCGLLDELPFVEGDGRTARSGSRFQ